MSRFCVIGKPAPSPPDLLRVWGPFATAIESKLEKLVEVSTEVESDEEEGVELVISKLPRFASSNTILKLARVTTGRINIHRQGNIKQRWSVYST